MELLGLNLERSFEAKDGYKMVKYTGEINGIKTVITSWGIMSGRHLVGYEDKLNICLYFDVPENMAKVFLSTIPKTDPEDPCPYPDYTYFSIPGISAEITFGEKNENGTYTIGFDYQHGWNCFENTDLLTVLCDAVYFSQAIKYESLKY